MKTLRQNFYLYTAIGCGLFIVLTLIAMLIYPGGNHTDPTQVGYSFSHNFFSDLGLRTAPNGQSNLGSGVLFFVALTLAGLALALFSLRFRQFFLDTRRSQIISLIGALLGAGAGISFIGVAFTPADVYLEVHVQFVMWAFRLFPLAVMCFTLVLFNSAVYPRGYAYVFLVFFGLLIAYYWLLTSGPGYGTPQGMVIQVVGQKIIVYASILSIFIQSLGAWKQVKSSEVRK